MRAEAFIAELARRQRFSSTELGECYMARTDIFLRTLRSGVSLLAFAVPIAAHAATQTTVTNTTWTVKDANGDSLGDATVVPANVAWTANIPGATWIWAPNQTAPASDTEFVFQTPFWLCGDPEDGGTIQFAADNYAEVRLNGTLIARTPPAGSFQAFSTVTSIIDTFVDESGATRPLRSVLAKNMNIIEVKARNASSTCQPDNYDCNPAGVLLKATFSDALVENPKCPDGSPAGTVRYKACTPPQTGFITSICACVSIFTTWVDWGKCVERCTDKDNKLVDVGQSESLPCAGEFTGSASHTCEEGGSWGATDYSNCVPPPNTCEGIPIGTIETRNCEAPRVGTESRTCLPTGQFENWSGICPLPFVGIREKCGGDEGETAQCPSGTLCGSRRFGCETDTFGKVVLGRQETRDRYCDADPNLPLVGVGEKCGSRTEGATAQCRFGSTCTLRVPGDAHYCDPNDAPPLPLGAACSGQNCNCASTYCDAGWNTGQTDLCMPRGGEGLAGDPCTDNTQCTSGTCNNLTRDANRRLIPGQCR
jgi:hypothetical protein